jgi:multisubunit Na+/H+ antiporter MnhC subunit
MMKTAIVITFALVSVMLVGCAMTNENSVNVSGQINYEYQKSL